MQPIGQIQLVAYCQCQPLQEPVVVVHNYIPGAVQAGARLAGDKMEQFNSHIEPAILKRSRGQQRKLSASSYLT